MKSKITTTWIALLAIASGVQAQDFGIRAGVSLNTITNLTDNSSAQGQGYSYSSENNYLLGYSVGGTLEFKIKENFGFVTGLTFRQAGAKITSEERYASTNGLYSYAYSNVIKIKTNYFEIPLYLKAGFTKGNTTIYGLFGGYVGLGFQGKIDYKYEYEETDNQGSTFKENGSESESLEFGFDKEKDDLQALNFGVLPGIGIEFKNFQLEATYNLGLSNNSFDDNETYRSQSINLTLGYKFGRKSN